MKKRLIEKLAQLLEYAEHDYRKYGKHVIDNRVERVAEIQESLSCLECNEIITFNSWSELYDLCGKCIHTLRKVEG